MRRVAQKYPVTLSGRIWRAYRGCMLAFLDTRGRWWLLPGLWVPFGIAVVIGAMSLQNQQGNSSSSYSSGLYVWDDDGVYRVGHPRDSGHRVWNVTYTVEYDVAPTEWTAQASCRVLRMEDPWLPEEEDPRELAKIRAVLADALAPGGASQPFVGFDAPRVGDWFREAWCELIGSGRPLKARRAPARFLVAYWGLEVAKWGTLVGMALSLVSAFVRRTQIAAYRRMLDQLGRGLCSACGYDISAAPGETCPECGCNHRERGREALQVLDQMERPATPLVRNL